MDIEYDPRKAASNLKKHGVSSMMLPLALLDLMALAREDDDAQGEARFVAVGMSSTGHLITICCALRDERDHKTHLSAQGNHQ